jgi:1-aminocyclopropane-1-carboxylate deaminase
MNFFTAVKNTTNQWIDPFPDFKIAIKREDQIHPIVSGNKFRKLKYNFTTLTPQKQQSLLSFGGAFSNHLAALATAGKMIGIPTIGIVRGQEWERKWAESATLMHCVKEGMQLCAVSREAYQLKEKSSKVNAFKQQFPQLICLPEGGTNSLAIKGCREILQPKDDQFDVVCTAVGTGGTLAGLVESSAENQYILGFTALNDKSLPDRISNFTSKKNWELINTYHFGGYAKVSSTLIQFINTFYQQYGIPLDPIYTGKMLFGIFDLIEQKKWKWGQKILIIHSGGLQGIAGINARLKRKGAAEIQF